MRKALTVAVAVVLFAGAAAYGEITDSPKVPTYTGCLQTADGSIYGVAEGGSPAAECEEGDSEIALSAGDVTDVIAGSGLLGGGDQGAVGLSIAPSFRLPQQCAGGAVPKWDPEIGDWYCAPDIDTTYNAGGGLQLDETNTFHLDEEAVSFGQVHTLWVSPHWETHFVPCETSNGRPCFSGPAQRFAEIWVLNLNGPAAPSGTLDTAIWWMNDGGTVNRIDEVTVPGGTRHRAFAPVADSGLRSGWLFVTSSKPVLAGGRQYSEQGVASYQMPFFPLDCSDGNALSFICERFGDQLKDAT